MRYFWTILWIGVIAFAAAGRHEQHTKLVPVVQQQAPAPARSNDVYAPLYGKAGNQFVSVILNDRVTLDMSVDSGAGILVIPRSAANQLIANGTLNRKRDFIRWANYTVADGRSVRDAEYRLRSVTVGGYTLTDVPCNIAPNDDVALLGQPFLGRFTAWAIDNYQHRLILRP